MSRLKSSSEIIGTHELKTIGMYKALAVEYLATLVLVLFGCGSTLDEKTDVVKVSLAFGLIITCLVHAFDHVSGCNINPAVTLGMLMARYISVTRALTYIVAQMLGGITAAGILYAITPAANRFGMGVCQINSAVTVSQAFCVELICTLVFVIIVFGATDKRRSDLKGDIALPIGLAGVVTRLFGIQYTGASLNPARAFGPALVVGGDAWANLWMYLVAPSIGGMIAGIVYTHIFRETKTNSLNISNTNETEIGKINNDTHVNTLP